MEQREVVLLQRMEWGGAGKKKSHPPLALRDGTEVSAGSPAGPGSGRSVWTPV